MLYIPQSDMNETDYILSIQKFATMFYFEAAALALLPLVNKQNDFTIDSVSLKRWKDGHLDGMEMLSDEPPDELWLHLRLHDQVDQ